MFITNKRLISISCKELPPINNKRIENPIDNKITQETDKQYKKNSPFDHWMSSSVLDTK